MLFILQNVNFSGLIEPGNICSYCPHREKYVKKGNGIGFAFAVKSCDEFLSDPQVGFHY